jgi:hypothetical protein
LTYIFRESWGRKDAANVDYMAPMDTWQVSRRSDACKEFPGLRMAGEPLPILHGFLRAIFLDPRLGLGEMAGRNQPRTVIFL